jgi:hypothetical protein
VADLIGASPQPQREEPMTPPDINKATSVANILGVPLADDAVRQWPQLGELYTVPS